MTIISVIPTENSAMAFSRSLPNQNHSNLTHATPYGQAASQNEVRVLGNQALALEIRGKWTWNFSMIHIALNQSKSSKLIK